MSIGILQRLKERKLVQWALAYLAGAWVALQVLHLLGVTYAWPPVVMRSIPVLLAVGFLAALVVAWYHGEKGQQRVSGPELLILAGLLVIGGAGITLVAAMEPTAASADGSASPPPAAATLTADRQSIAVLPFANLSADPEQEYFSDGLTEELLSVLAQIPELRVAARSSSFAFKGARLHAALRDRDRTLEWLERSLAEDPTQLLHQSVSLKTNVAFDFLGADPRFQRLLAQLGIS